MTYIKSTNQQINNSDVSGVFNTPLHQTNQQINKSTNQQINNSDVSGVFNTPLHQINQQINKSTNQQFGRIGRIQYAPTSNKSTNQQINFYVSVLLIMMMPLGSMAARLSAEAQITMLTASPGDELYSVFGHSALRVYDPVTGIDEVYNYGTFDFNTPNFYLQFTRGKLMYQLSVSTFPQFLLEYEYEQRAVYEQILTLNPEEKQRIYDFLQINRLPENRSYLYDFFYDNCATRIRDVVHDLLDIQWGEDPYPGTPQSFRDMLQPYLANMPWAAFGIDLALGLPADKIASPWHYMFLPDEMFTAFAQARRLDGRPLVSEHNVVLQGSTHTSGPSPITPVRTLWLVFIIGCLSLLHKRFSLVFDRIFFSVLGLAGIVIAMLWVFSDHLTTNQNMNLLWAIPTHLYFIFRVERNKMTSAVRYYFLVTGLLSALMVIFWWAIPQGFNAAFFPLVLLAGVKALR